MNALFAIAADFFEHLTNPAFGRETNDSYDFRFHVLMRSDAETAQQLATAPLGRDDVRSMSAAAWLWYLAWRESIAREQPSVDFLDTLYEETANPVLRLKIVEFAVRGGRRSRVENDKPVAGGLTDMPPSWVRDRVRNIVEEMGFSAEDTDVQRVRIEGAWELLSYLIEVGSNEGLNAARVLLTERWPGAGALRERALELVAQMQLTDEDDFAFRARIGLQQ